MRILLSFTGIFAFIFLLFSCSKKVVPPPASDNVRIIRDTAVTVKETDAPVKKTETKKIVTAVPKVITVNDASAKQTPEGRYYYDLEGHRYWRNKKDGKYYLYNKAMYKDDAFKP
jgi:hypothetical protein